MATARKETLAVSVESLEEVIRVIRSGMRNTKIADDTAYSLNKWCNAKEFRLREMRML